MLKRLWLRMTGVPACQNCGLCCAPSTFASPTEYAGGYVTASALDRAVMSASTRLRVLNDDGETLKMGESPDWKCVALEGTPREHVSCGIYEERPLECRRFEPGAPKCRFVLARSRQLPENRKGNVWEWHPWWHPAWMRRLDWWARKKFLEIRYDSSRE